MRTATFVAVLFIAAVFSLLSPEKASAIGINYFDESLSQPSRLLHFNAEEFLQTAEPPQEATEVEEEVSEETETEEVTEVIYVVQAGDSLEAIAEAHDTTWQRLFDKNTFIDNPNLLEIGDELAIPAPDEVLEERAAPEPVVAAAPVVQQTTRPAAAAVRGDSSGNTYYYGYCTWYAKNRRPDLPNNLGNANTWAARAAAQGYATGYTPRVGAIAQQGMHVAYVESVNGDGTVTLSEMNFNGWNVISSRTVPADQFVYIY